MKKMIFVLGWLIVAHLSFAQPKPLQACDSITKQFAAIKDSYDKMVATFKTEKDLLSTNGYKSDFSICGEKGELTEYSTEAKFKFSYGNYKYKGGKEEYLALFEKFFTSLNEVFGASLKYEKTEKDTYMFYEFYEKGKFSLASKKKIELWFSFKKESDAKNNYFITLTFEHYLNR